MGMKMDIFSLKIDPNPIPKFLGFKLNTLVI
jgi:hypothetical protein